VIRLADLLAGLSRLADLGYGLPQGEAVRSAALAALFARSLELPEADVRAALYTALLQHVGCTGYAHETARVSGDELSLFAAAERANVADPWDVLTTFLPTFTRGLPPAERLRLVFVTLRHGKRNAEGAATAACEVGRDAARRLGLPVEVQHAVYRSYEWWNGGGAPDGLRGDAVPVPSRVALVTSVAGLFDSLGGRDLAIVAVRERAGGILDPHLADHFGRHADSLLAEVNRADPRDVLLDAEPHPLVAVLPPDLADVAAVFADIADLKTPYTHGHSRGVAALAAAAAGRSGMDAATVDEVEVAGLLHDVGRVAISNAVWEKAGELDAHEREQVRLHAYHSERILAGSEQLAPLGRLVGTHHERLDRSGYHRGCGHSELGMPARILAAADAYQAMTQRRQHRQALPAAAAESQLLADVQRGVLDAGAVSAVLAAAGHDAAPVRTEAPAGLTAREIEVLELVAAGCSNPEIADRLVIARRTAEHHVQNIYAKIGVSSRAAAALFAMEHGLLGDR
jgi:HD-GYP domain-containing protein (c-di-GMP phosphodiesterase class II)